MADWCGNAATVYLAGPTLGPSPRLTIVAGTRAVQMIDGAQSMGAHCLDCAVHAVERLASPPADQDRT
jgi:hypothetical protein